MVLVGVSGCFNRSVRGILQRVLQDVLVGVSHRLLKIQCTQPSCTGPDEVRELPKHAVFGDRVAHVDEILVGLVIRVIVVL